VILFISTILVVKTVHQVVKRVGAVFLIRLDNFWGRRTGFLVAISDGVVGLGGLGSGLVLRLEGGRRSRRLDDF